MTPSKTPHLWPAAIEWVCGTPSSLISSYTSAFCTKRLKALSKVKETLVKSYKNSLNFNVYWSAPNVKMTPHASERQGQDTRANERSGQETMSPG